MSEETTHLVERLRRRLRRTVRRLTLGELAFGLAVTLGALAALWLASAVLEAGLWMPTGPRTGLAVALGATTLALFGVFVARPLGRLVGVLEAPSEEEAARHVGSHFPERVADRFVNLLQLAGGARSGRADHHSAPLADRAVARLGREVEGVEFERVEDFSRARRASRLAAVPVAGLLVFLLAAPSAFLGASSRLLAPTDHFQRPAPFRLALTPGGADLVKGDSLAVTVHTRPAAQQPAAQQPAAQQPAAQQPAAQQPAVPQKALPSTVTLQVQAGLGENAEEHVRDLTLSPADSSGGRFRHVFVGVRQGFRYRAVAEANGHPIRTGWKEARVAERPRVSGLRVTLSPPAYSGLPERTLASGTGDVTALPGTEVSVRTTLAGPRAEQALLRFDGAAARGSSVDTLTVEGGTASGSFTLTDDGSYRVALQSERGAPNADPIRYRLQTTADAAPTVSFRAPEAEAELTGALRPQLRWQMSDDFGFAAQKLYYRLTERRLTERRLTERRLTERRLTERRLTERRRGAGSADGEPMKEFKSVKVPTDRPGLLDQTVTYDWLLRQTTDLDVTPGDVLEYYVRVWDNDRVAGYQSARTQTQRLRLPTLEEKYEKLGQMQQGAEEQMQRLQDQSDQARRQFENLREGVRRKRKGDWEDQRQVEQLEERRQQMQQSAEQLQRQIEKAARQMKQGQLTSPQTQRQYRELQQVARQIQSPKLEKALQKLKKAMQEMDMEKMQQAMKDFEFNEKQYRERLKRTKELFKKIKAQQQMEEVARRAGELAEQEHRLDEETRKLEKRGEEEKQNRRQGKEEKEERQEGKKAEGEKSSGEKSSGEKAKGQRSQQQKRNGERRKRGQQQKNGRQQQQPGRKKQRESSAEKREELAKDQEQAREKMKKLRKKMQQLSKDMKGMRGAPQKQMQKMQQGSQQMPKQMKQNSRQLRKNQLQKAQQGQQSLQQQLQQMQRQMRQMQQGMQKKQKRINMAGLRQALANTLRLSKDQEALRGRTGGLSAGSPALREVARHQHRLAEGLRTTRDSLTALAREIPKMTRAVQKESGEALHAMEQATEAMTGRTARRGGGHQKTAMKNLNDLALLLSRLMKQMQQSQSGQGMSMSAQQMKQQLQQMAGQQKQLNGQVQKMLNGMQGDRLSRSQSKRLKQMARRQKAIQKQLEKLREQGGGTKALGDLERVAEQMGKTIDEMRHRRLNRKTLERQQQILSRLLQARQSLQKRGKKDQRRSQTADGDYTRERPADSTPEQDAERLRRSLIRSLESGYTPDYEQLIKRYFELLQQQQQESGQSNAPQQKQ